MGAARQDGSIVESGHAQAECGKSGKERKTQNKTLTFGLSMGR